MRFIGNEYDPRRGDTFHHVQQMGYEERGSAFAHQVRWLDGKVLGEPVVTPCFSVDQLKEWGLVGVYEPETPEEQAAAFRWRKLHTSELVNEPGSS